MNTKNFDEELEMLDSFLGLPTNEGTKLTSYIPVNNRKDAAKSKSGITIAKGYDLGYRSLEEINDLPVSEEVKAKLRPLVGLTGTAAWDYFKSNPKVTISEDDEKKISLHDSEPVLKNLIKNMGDKRWGEMSDNLKRISFAAVSQYGDYYKYDLFKDTKAGDLGKVKKNLATWKDKTEGKAKYSIMKRYKRYANLPLEGTSSDMLTKEIDPNSLGISPIKNPIPLDLKSKAEESAKSESENLRAYLMNAPLGSLSEEEKMDLMASTLLKKDVDTAKISALEEEGDEILLEMEGDEILDGMEGDNERLEAGIEGLTPEEAIEYRSLKKELHSEPEWGM